MSTGMAARQCRGSDIAQVPVRQCRGFFQIDSIVARALMYITGRQRSPRDLVIAEQQGVRWQSILGLPCLLKRADRAASSRRDSQSLINAAISSEAKMRRQKESMDELWH